MTHLLQISLIGLFFGVFGTTIGGIMGISFHNTSKKFLSLILEFAAGMMTSIVCFELIPEAMKLSTIWQVVFGILFGVFVMVTCDFILNKKYDKYMKQNTNSLLKAGIIIGIGLALHNFPEGLAIGSGFETSITLGYSLALAILLHDIPEGISMAVPMKNGGMNKSKVIIYTSLSGITTALGAFFGAVAGEVSTILIPVCLSFAAGAMLYIVSGELIPESKKLYMGRLPSLTYIFGIILGIFSSLI